MIPKSGNRFPAFAKPVFGERLLLNRLRRAKEGRKRSCSDQTSKVRRWFGNRSRCRYSRPAMRAFLLAGLFCALIATAAAADPVADFYRGKTITILIGVGAGGEYDLQARLVGKYLGRYVPGNPTVVAQNMTGASGLKMTNYLASVAPHDGTYIGMIMNGLPALQAVGLEGVQFDAATFNWLGAIAPVDETITIWHTAGVTTVDGARQKEVVTGATARGSITYTFPQMMNELFGTRF